MSDYIPPAILFNGHLQTIYPSVMRKVETEPYVLQRIETPDDDFLDLGWLTHHSPTNNSNSLVIVLHGLEGNMDRAYVRGMARAFYGEGFDTLSWNYRGCGNEMNRKTTFYHSGATEDLKTIVNHVVALTRYENIYLVGFSLGGNIALKYLGENGKNVPVQVRKAVALSVPMDLTTGCAKISSPGNWLYSQRFLRSLKKKIKAKAALQPALDTTGIDDIKTLLEFDNRYTARLHGFKDAADYYIRCSANLYLDGISIPTLIINAQNDPFLTPECSPVERLRTHPFVKLETPARGGHVGFALFNANELYWSELKALEFILP